MADSVTFICPHCGDGMRLAPEHLGREGRCAHCGEGVTTPTEAEIASLGADDAADEASPEHTVNDLSLSMDERIDRLLTPPYLFMGVLFPLIILWYCGWFGLVRQDIWFGGVAYGGEAYGGMITGRPAMIMGLGGVIVAAGFHVNSFWAILTGSKVFNRIGNLLVYVGLIVFFASLIVPPSP